MTTGAPGVAGKLRDQVLSCTAAPPTVPAYGVSKYGTLVSLLFPFETTLKTPGLLGKHIVDLAGISGNEKDSE